MRLQRRATYCPTLAFSWRWGAIAQPLPATKSGREGWTTDVAIGLRYTELLHATHNFCSVPMFDKGLAVALCYSSSAEWTLEQLRAAGFGRHRALRD